MTDLSPVDSAYAEAAVDDFFSDSGWQKQIAEYGWNLTRPAPLLVIVALRARPYDGQAHAFTLRLECEYYPTHPPDVRFVNPETLEYDPKADEQHLPKLHAPYCYVHPVYPYQSPSPYGVQLVCSSMTLGYYISGHNPQPHERWEPEKHTIGTSIYIVHRALHSEHYQGRVSA